MDHNTWNKFVDWWAECDEQEISKNELLDFAFKVMWFNDEVLNGGYYQFFDNKGEQWDMKKTSKLFKKYLPKEIYNQFDLAQKAFKRDDDCEEFTNEYDEAKMQSFLEELARKVVNII